jgi:hypothetical protein
MSSTDSVEGVQDTHAQAYARALEVWGQWLRHWRRTGAPRALHATLICREIAGEKLAAWKDELGAHRSVRQAIRAAQAELALDQKLAQIRRDEQALDPVQRRAIAHEATRWSRGIAMDELAEALVAEPVAPQPRGDPIRSLGMTTPLPGD